jgi:hypothetical protein
VVLFVPFSLTRKTPKSVPLLRCKASSIGKGAVYSMPLQTANGSARVRVPFSLAPVSAGNSATGVRSKWAMDSRLAEFPNSSHHPTLTEKPNNLTTRRRTEGIASDSGTWLN